MMKGGKRLDEWEEMKVSIIWENMKFLVKIQHEITFSMEKKKEYDEERRKKVKKKEKSFFSSTSSSISR